MDGNCFDELATYGKNDSDNDVKAIAVSSPNVVCSEKYRMFVMKTPTPNWAELILSNYGEFYLCFFLATV